MLNILFYGASVTAQSGDSGFVDNLAELDNSKIYRRLSFGSSQFDNAGFFNLLSILNSQQKPDIVFFEWSTTSENNYNADKLDYFVTSLLHHNILPVFLILPRTDTFKENRKSEFLLYELADTFDVPLLDLRYLLHKYPATELLRDIVHTTQFGANIYARKINKFLCAHDWTEDFLTNKKEIEFKKYYDLNMIELNKEIGKDQYLELNFDALSDLSEITISLLKGPYAPIIDIFSNDLLVKEQSIFDPWCHYERENFTTLIYSSSISKGRNKIDIKISNKDPDYESTKTGEIFLGEKKLKIKSFFTNDINNFNVFVKNV